MTKLPLPAREVVFKTPFGAIHGKRWGKEGALPVLALHGWLDNCATFDSLSGQLNNVDLVAIDLPGHGRSDFRRADGPYNMWQDLHEVHAVIKELGWKSFSLLGHSRGAMVSFLYAGTFPESVSHLACLDALWPLSADAEKCPEQLATAIEAVAEASSRRKSHYASFDAAVFARCHGVFRLVKRDAEVLAKRGLAETESGYYWRFDPKLLLQSEVKFTPEQIKAFLRRIKVPILLLSASEGVLQNKMDFLEELKAIGQIIDERVEGGHHLHMSEKTDFVAHRLNRYFLTRN